MLFHVLANVDVDDWVFVQRPLHSTVEGKKKKSERRGRKHFSAPGE
jgi:hypothetical protein